jgi:hypothetical protein
MPKKLTENDKSTLQKLYHFAEMVSKQRPDVPPTRDELANLGASKQDLKNLERLELVQSRTMVLDQHYRNGSKVTSGRVVYALTDVGREVCTQLGFRTLTEPKPIQVLPPEPKPIQILSPEPPPSEVPIAGAE